MKENSKLPLILVLALPILLIISTELSYVDFSIFGQTFYVGILIFPLTLFVSVLISKKAESKNAIMLVILALITQCLAFVLKWVFFGITDYVLMAVTFFTFFLSQLVILLGYESLKEMKKDRKFGYVLCIFLIADLIEVMFYLSIYSDLSLISIIVNIIIQIIYDLIFAKILIK